MTTPPHHSLIWLTQGVVGVLTLMGGLFIVYAQVVIASQGPSFISPPFQYIATASGILFLLASVMALPSLHSLVEQKTKRVIRGWKRTALVSALIGLGILFYFLAILFITSTFS